MFKFTKTQDPENNFSRSDITFEIDNDDIALDALLEEFESFLRAVGYHVPFDYLRVEKDD